MAGPSAHLANQPLSTSLGANSQVCERRQVHPTDYTTPHKQTASPGVNFNVKFDGVPPRKRTPCGHVNPSYKHQQQRRDQQQFRDFRSHSLSALHPAFFTRHTGCVSMWMCLFLLVLSLASSVVGSTIDGATERGGARRGELKKRREWARALCSRYPITLPLHQAQDSSTQTPSDRSIDRGSIVRRALDLAFYNAHKPNIGASEDGAEHINLEEALNLELNIAAPSAGIPGETNRNGYSAISFDGNRQSYFTLIQVGEIFFRVSLDTASSDLWLVSSECNEHACRDIPKYPLAYQSPTFSAVNANNTAFTARYVDQTMVSGFIARESIKIANLTVPAQPFALIDKSNVTLRDQTSGLLGLGFSRLSSITASVNNTAPFFVTLAQQGLLDYPLFGFSLPSNGTKVGTLTFGAIDASIVKKVDEINWNPVVQFPPFLGTRNGTAPYLHWALPLASISVTDGSRVQIAPSPTYSLATDGLSYSLFDVGSSGIYGPIQDVARIYASIKGARLVDVDGQWVVPCNTNATLSFTFGEETYNLHPIDYLIGPVSSNPNLCFSWPRSQPPRGDGLDWQFGTPFLRTMYTIFSYGINTKEPPMIGLYSLPRNFWNTTDQTPPSSISIPPASPATSVPFSSTLPPEPIDISSFFSAISMTITTNLPNSLLSTPTFVIQSTPTEADPEGPEGPTIANTPKATLPPYIFNTSVAATVGGIVSSELATSTYIAHLASALVVAQGPVESVADTNASALPMITPPIPLPNPTIVVTDESGAPVSTSTVLMASPALGIPPGWQNGALRNGREGIMDGWVGVLVGMVVGAVWVVL